MSCTLKSCHRLRRRPSANFNDTRLAELNKEAGDARNEAGVAVERASKADERASTNEKEAARITKENLVLQADLLRLRKESESRRLTGSQKNRLRLLLRERPTTIVVATNRLDNKSSDFADDFISVFTEARWNPVMALWVGSKYGVSIGAVWDDETKNAPEFKLLSAALGEIGVLHDVVSLIEGDRSMAPPVAPHVLYLIIDPHPPIKPKSEIK